MCTYVVGGTARGGPNQIGALYGANQCWGGGVLAQGIKYPGGEEKITAPKKGTFLAADAAGKESRARRDT